MMDSIHDVSLLLGQLKAQIDNLAEDNRHATKARKATYETLEKIRQHIQTTERRVEAIEKRLEAVEKPISEIQRWQERGIGAIMLIGFACALLGGSTVFFWQKIMMFVKQWT